MKSKEKLVHDLMIAKAPAFIIQKAIAGDYDDFESNSATPINDLVRDCLNAGMTSLDILAKKAIAGIYDGTKEEADEWYQREGKELF